MEKQLRILYVTSWYPTGHDPTLGIFIKRHAIASSDYCNVTVAYAISDASINETKTTSVQTEIKEVIIQYPKVRTSIPFVSTLIKLYRYIKFNFVAIVKSVHNIPDYDVVQVNIVFPVGIMALLLKWIYNIPYIIVENWTGYLPSDGSYKGRLKKYLTKLIVKNASAVVVVSIDLKNEMLKHGLKSKYHIVPNVVDESVFYVKPTYQLNNSSANQPINILHVSTLNDEHKNISGIIHVAEKLKGLNYNFILHIVGEGPERKKHEELCLQKGLLNTHVKFYGHKNENEIAGMMNDSHFLVLFSNYENLPCVMIEAMMCGLPVISSDVGGIAEYINHERGILVTAGNEDELLNAIPDMVKNYHTFDRTKISQYAKEHFGRKVVGKQLNDIYKQVLNN